MGITPMPIIVETIGMPLFVANAVISSRAPASTTPPPQQITGRSACSIAASARLICTGCPCVVGL